MVIKIIKLIEQNENWGFVSKEEEDGLDRLIEKCFLK